jgi:ppGpp synthetase/RelA/SpoT-type nucleotidyltranferase
LDSTSKLIRNYITEYSERIDYYLEAAKACKEQCETLLERNGIRGMTTYRAKRPDHLEQKLLKRVQEGRFGNLEDNFRDIPDLAGVRIALYFPGDHAKAVELIKDSFLIQLVRTFPEKAPPEAHTARAGSSPRTKRFAGYSATHFRLHLKPESLHPTKERYTRALIELQIASVLMHAWAEVEHDLVYKPFEGQLSEQELALLDQVNGLVMAGEIALEQLQEAIQLRVAGQDKPFNNPYELAALLHNTARAARRDSAAEPVIGRADLLLDFLREVGLDRASLISSLIENMNWANEPLSDQLIARAVAIDPELTEARTAAYEKVLGNASQMTGQAPSIATPIPSPVTLFIKRWVTLEQALRAILRSSVNEVGGRPRSVPLTRSMIGKLEVFSEEELAAIERLQKMRHHLIDTDLTPSQKQLEEASAVMARLIKKLFDQVGPDLAETSE